ncbi:MAG: hypothetical protein HFI36_06515 [Bacilli bacterium]|jgi:uncharacterized protein Veg|nr:hypothetical protein [Bacilli bacterium]MCX4253998.1 Veg family protein [Bacilli bacterium]
MNPNFIKEEVEKHLNKNVEIKAYGMRNKVNYYSGTITAIYPNIFTIKSPNYEKSFSYADIITGDIKVKYE